MDGREDDRRGRRPVRRAVRITEVADAAGVSIATVSRVLNGIGNKASVETEARVRRAAEALGYRPLKAGRALRGNRSGLVGLLAANLANPAMAAIASAAEAALRQAGLTMLLCDTHDRPELQDEYLREMRAHMAQAIVLLGAVESPGLAAMRAAGEPMVFVNRVCPGDPAAPFVGIDNRSAGAEVAERLVARGAVPLAVIHGPLHSSATAERLAGFRDRAAALGAPVAGGCTLSTADGDHLLIGYGAAARLLEARPRPRGLFCSSDLIAFGAHRRLREAGLAVPGDVAVVGFDDTPLNPWVAPWLSSVKVPYEAFGEAIRACVASLLGGAPGGRTVLPHRFNDRWPSGPQPGPDQGAG